MSRSLNMKLGLSAIVMMSTASTALALWSRYDEQITPQRQIATLKFERAMGKHLSAMSVQLLSAKEIPESESDEVKLEGYITPNQNFGNLEYQWDLPKGVSLMAGADQGSFSNVTSGQPIKIEIIVRGFSKEEQKQIILVSKAVQGDSELSSSALITSRPEDSMEYIAPQLREHAEETRPEEFAGNRRLVK